MIRGGRASPSAKAVKLVLEACHHGSPKASIAAGIPSHQAPRTSFSRRSPTEYRHPEGPRLRARACRGDPAATTARGSARGPASRGCRGYASPGAARHRERRRCARRHLGPSASSSTRRWPDIRPFEAANLQDALIAAATPLMPPLTAGRPIPIPASGVVRKCLEKDRENHSSVQKRPRGALRPYAPAAFAHYVDRVKAVGGPRNPFVGTVRTVAPRARPHRDGGTFATDTFTTEASPDSIMPLERDARATDRDATDARLRGGVRRQPAARGPARAHRGRHHVPRRAHRHPERASRPRRRAWGSTISPLSRCPPSPSPLGPLPPLAPASTPPPPLRSRVINLDDSRVAEKPAPAKPAWRRDPRMTRRQRVPPSAKPANLMTYR